VFTEQQPKDGDVVLHCGHLKDKCHFFKVPQLRFRAPNGEAAEAEWIVLCEECYNKNPYPKSLADFPIAGHSTWVGDEPEIEVNPQRGEGKGFEELN
jgi:hypothetical protein